MKEIYKCIKTGCLGYTENIDGLIVHNSMIINEGSIIRLEVNGVYLNDKKIKSNLCLDFNSKLIENITVNPAFIFREELEMIVDIDLNRFALYLLNKIPSWFFYVPATSSGKYHPPRAKENGGLVWHTKTACRIGNDLCNTIDTDEETRQLLKDEVVFALMFHDCCKLGNSETKAEKTLVDHPLLAARFIKKIFYGEFLTEYVSRSNLKLFTEKVERCCNLIESHMGRWDAEENYLPTQRLNLIVHYADYIASGLHRYNIEDVK